jgi:hypothetical protein
MFFTVVGFSQKFARWCEVLRSQDRLFVRKYVLLKESAFHFIGAEILMSKLTIFLARSIGLFTLLLVAGFLVRGEAAVETAVADGPVMLSYAIISLAMGLAMVLGHNVWSGGALPVVVTLVGWLIFAKGLLLLVLSPDSLGEMIHRMGYREHFPLLLAPAAVLGLYLTLGGFVSQPDGKG